MPVGNYYGVFLAMRDVWSGPAMLTRFCVTNVSTFCAENRRYTNCVAEISFSFVSISLELQYFSTWNKNDNEN